MATIYKTDGKAIEIEPKNGNDFQLEELKSVVGGFIEIVHLRDGRLMVVNEEGRLIGLRYNRMATLLYGHDIIVGDVLVCEKKQIK